MQTAYNNLPITDRYIRMNRGSESELAMQKENNPLPHSYCLTFIKKTQVNSRTEQKKKLIPTLLAIEFHPDSRKRIESRRQNRPALSPSPYG